MTFAACKRSGGEVLRQDTRNKFFWVGNNQGTSGVGVLLAEKWVDKVYDIKRVSDRIMLIKLLVGRLSSWYCRSMPLKQDWRSPQRMHSTTACKLSFQNYQIKKYSSLAETGMDTLDEKQLDMKVFMEVLGMANVMQMVIVVLEFAVANDFVIGNTFFVKRR